MLILSDREISVFGGEHNLWARYTTHRIDGTSEYVRLACTLVRLDNNGIEEKLAYVRKRVRKDTDFSAYIQENAKEIFGRALKRNPNTEQLYQDLYAGPHPFAEFVERNFVTVAQLHGWESSTQHQYYLTLRQLTKYLPRAPLTQLRGKDFALVIRRAEEQFAEKRSQRNQRDREYSESRINQFLITLNAIMSFAAEGLQIRNPLLDSVRYQDYMQGKKEKQRSIESLIERYLKPRELQTQQQIKAAEDIMSQIQAGDPYAIGVAIQDVAALRPSETCGAQWASLIPFTREGWQDRYCLLVCRKVEYRSEETSHELKTIHAYRAIPVQIDLQAMLDAHVANTRGAQETDEKFGRRYIVEAGTRQGKAVKTEEYCRHSKKILQAAAKGNAEFFTLQIPIEIDDAGVAVRLDEDETAYRWRHNGGSLWMNEAGLTYETTQALYGHKSTEAEVKRWVYYHEDELISQLQEMDKLVFFPAKSREDVEREPWRRMDPREEIREVDGCCTYDNLAAGKFLVKPYSDTDQVTVRMILRPNEPGDSISYTVKSQAAVDVEADPVYFRSHGPERVNLWNDYWDRVYKGSPTAQVTDQSAESEESEIGEHRPFEHPDSDILFIEDDNYISPDEDDWDIDDAEESE